MLKLFLFFFFSLFLFPLYSHSEETVSSSGMTTGDRELLKVLQRHEQELLSKMDNFINRIREQDIRIDRQGEMLEKVMQENASLLRENEDLSEKVTTLHKAFEEYKKRKPNPEGEEKWKKRVQQLETDKKAMVKKVEELTGELSVKEGDIASLRKDNLRLQERTRQLQQAVQTAGGGAEQQQDIIKGLQRDKLVLQKKNHLLQERNNRLREENNVLLSRQEERIKPAKALVSHATPRFIRNIEVGNRVSGELDKQVHDPRVQVRHFTDHTVITLQGDEMFSSGSALLEREYRGLVKKIGRVLQGFPDIAIEVVGHTDSDPIHTEDFSNNWELSGARASKVAQFLTTQTGVRPQRIKAVGKAEYEPVASNDTPEGKRRNRRIEIILRVPSEHEKEVQGADIALIKQVGSLSDTHQHKQGE